MLLPVCQSDKDEIVFLPKMNPCIIKNDLDYIRYYLCHNLHHIIIIISTPNSITVDII